jgi:Tfp pilus assembly protein PilN
MEEMSSTMFVLIVAWSIVTVALILMWIYRSTLENREEDQIFLDAAQESMAQEQRMIVARIEKLSKPITLLIVVSSALLLVIAGMWLWQGFKNF